MFLDFEIKDNILIAFVQGELDHHGAGSIREEIDKTMEAFRCSSLILDFSKITFMDSSGIGVIMGRYNKVKEKNGKIIIVVTSPYINKILEMSGIYKIVEKVDSKEEAILAVAESQIPDKKEGEVE